MIVAYLGKNNNNYMKLDLQNAMLEKVQTMQDGTIQLRIGLPELSAEEMARIFTAKQEGIIELELDMEAGEKKTPSARLRAILYVLWEQQYKEKYKEFAVFYAAKMETLINSIKEQLNP